MANFNFSADITDVVDYVEIKESRYTPVDATVLVSSGVFDVNNTYNNIINLSDELYIPFDALVFSTIRGWIWGPRRPHRGKVYARGGGYIPVELTNYFDVPK